jgi:hypothetical protein
MEHLCLDVASRLTLTTDTRLHAFHGGTAAANITERRCAMDVAMTALASEGLLRGLGHVGSIKFLIRLLRHRYLMLG